MPEFLLVSPAIRYAYQSKTFSSLWIHYSYWPAALGRLVLYGFLVHVLAIGYLYWQVWKGHEYERSRSRGGF